MTTHSPKISIGIPNYNRPNLLMATLNSAANQTKRPFEIVVVDNASTKDLSAARKLVEKRGWSWFDNQQNLGMMANFNQVIRRAKGDYLALVHSDDLISKYFIEKAQRFILQYPGFKIYTTNCAGINHRDQVVAEYRLFNQDKIVSRVKGARDLWNRDYFSLFSILGCTIYERKFIQEHLFQESWENEADLDQALRILAQEDVMYVNEAIYYTRIHAGQASAQNKFDQEQLEKYICNRLLIHQEYQSAFAIVPKFVEKIKAIHLAQLLGKYKYRLAAARSLLGIKSQRELFGLFLLWPGMAARALIRKFNFRRRRREVERNLN